MTYATPEDVAAELGRSADSITATERAQWQRWLDRIERAIEARFRRAGLDLATQVSAGDPTAEDVADVEVAAVVRKIESPKMAAGSSRTVSIDDGSITDRNDLRGDYDPLALTDADWALLLPGNLGGAFSTRPGFQADRPEWRWP